MIARCHNPKSGKYSFYGARGISVCDRWRNSFDDFVADMGPRPTGSTIEREHNAGNYEPENCRWATVKEQARNRRSNRIITFNGETLTLAEWCERYNLHQVTVGRRLNAGWPPEAAFELEENWHFRKPNSHIIEIGCFVGTLKEWCEALNLKRSTISERIRRGWSSQKALGYGC